MAEVSSDMLCSSSASLLGDNEGALEYVEAWRRKSGRGGGCSGARGVIVVHAGGGAVIGGRIRHLDLAVDLGRAERSGSTRREAGAETVALRHVGGRSGAVQRA